MASPNIGFGASVGLAEEATWGTAAARTNWLYIYQCTIERTFTREPLGDLGASGGAHLGPRWTIDREEMVEGAIEWPMAYDDSSVLLVKHGIGSIATTGPSGTQYTHTADLALPSAWPVGLTVEKIFGIRGATKNAEVFEGGRCRRFVLSGEWGQPVRGRFEGIWQTSGGVTTAGTPTYHTGTPSWIHANHTGNLVWGSINDKIRSWRLTVDHGTQRRNLLGEITTGQPWPTAANITLEVTREWDETSAETDYASGASNDLTMAFTGTGDNAMTIALDGAKIMRRSHPITERGITLQTLTFQPFAATDALEIVIKNSNSTATAN